MKSTTPNNTNIFLTKRRLYFFIASFLVFVALTIVALVSILNIDFLTLFNNIGEQFRTSNLSALFFIIILAAPVFRTVQLALAYYFICKKKNIKVTFLETIWVALIFIFIVSITPSSIGGEPFLIYWLRRKNLEVSEASAVVLLNSTGGQAMSLLVTWPSYIYLLTLYNSFIDTPNGQLIFWFSTVGMILDAIVMISFIITSTSSHMHYYISLVFNQFLKFFKFNYKNKEEIRFQLRQNKSFRKLLATEYRNYWIVTYIFVSNAAVHVILYTLMFVSIGMVFDYQTISFSDVYNFTNIATTANNFIPLPGSEGSLQLLLKAMLGWNNKIDSAHIDQGIFVWRFSWTYSINIVGFIVILPLAIKTYIKYRARKKAANTAVEKSNISK